MKRALIPLIACFLLTAATDSLLVAQHKRGTQAPKGARHFSVFNHEAVVFPNIHIHPNPTTEQFEPSIATHPLNPNIVLAAAATQHLLTGPFARIGYYYTTNGGTTWSGRDTLPTHPNLSIKMNDPDVGIDLRGNLFVCGIYGNNIEIEFLAWSTDGGANWDQTTVVNEQLLLDKPSVTINTNAGTPHENHIYFTYSDWATVPGPIKFSRSTDGGQNFSTPVSISGSVGLLRHTGVKHLAVSPENGLYATWVGGDAPESTFFHLGFNQSSDGGISWATPIELDTINKISTLIKGGTPIFSVNKASIDVDRSSGARRGWIYIVYAETTSTGPDIFLIRSTDAGSSWSSAQKVNQDTSGKDSWLPIVAVDQATGALFVVYYDSRNFPANDSAEVFISASVDGGVTFEDILVSDVPFLPRPLLRNPASGNYMGSYIGISALQGIVWPCWMDNRTGILQVYTSRIEFPPIPSVDEDDGIPGEYRLYQCYPNPFNPSTTFSFDIPHLSFVILKVYDLLGQEVATLANEEMKPGNYEVTWDASGMASGVYLYRLQAKDFVEAKKLVLLR